MANIPQPEKYTGLNRILKSQAVQVIVDKLDDGTFAEFFSDWKWIFGYSKRYKWIIVLYTIMGLLSTTLGLGASVLSAELINIITGYDFSRLWILVIAMIGSTVFSLVFSSLVSRLSTKISIYVNNDIQADIFDKIVDASWMDLTKYPNGDLMNRFNTDVSAVSGNAVNWVPNLINALYNFIATLVVILWYDPTMALIAFISAPFLLLASRYIMRKNKEYRKKVLEMNSKLMGFEMETFYNMDTIKSFGVMKRYGRELRKWQDKYKDYSLDYNMFSIKTSIYMTVLNTIVSFAAFGYCLFRLWTHSIQYGTMTLFLEQRSKLSNTFSNIISIVPGMLNSSVSAHRIRELVELPREEHIEASHALDKYVDDGFTVQMKDLNFSYVEGTKVIRDSDFIAKPGEIVALVGPSGEGKTTMIRLILGLMRPQEGKVVLRPGYVKDEDVAGEAAVSGENVLNGESARAVKNVVAAESTDAISVHESANRNAECADMEKDTYVSGKGSDESSQAARDSERETLAIDMNAETRHLFAYVPQGNTILAGTVAENLRMIKEDASDEEIIEALKIACAWDFIEKMPDTINCPIGERGRGFSEGQAQRISIARAVLRNSPILLLDEATSALDVTTERQVLRNIIQQRPNKTVIVTTHRPSVLNMCQRVYRVMETKVTELSEAESAKMAMDF